MAAFRPSKLIAVAALLLSPQAVSACVQFSLNVAHYDFDGVSYGSLSAALTDNGGQKCQLSGVITPNYPTGSYSLSCVGGYSASFSFDTLHVQYAYGSFSGDFGTSTYYDWIRNADYYVANVWGC